MHLPVGLRLRVPLRSCDLFCLVKDQEDTYRADSPPLPDGTHVSRKIRMPSISFVWQDAKRKKGAKEIKQSSVQPIIIIFFLKKRKEKKKADFVLWEARLPLLLPPPRAKSCPKSTRSRDRSAIAPLQAPLTLPSRLGNSRGGSRQSPGRHVAPPFPWRGNDEQSPANRWAEEAGIAASSTLKSAFRRREEKGRLLRAVVGSRWEESGQRRWWRGRFFPP